MLYYLRKEKCNEVIPSFRDSSSVLIFLYFIKEDLVLKDKTIVCVDCGKEFIFTVNEQEFYKEKGFDNEPKRCPDCRRARKNQKNQRNNY